jgi:hypothetical protein
VTGVCSRIYPTHSYLYSAFSLVVELSRSERMAFGLNILRHCKCILLFPLLLSACRSELPVTTTPLNSDVLPIASPPPSPSIPQVPFMGVQISGLSDFNQVSDLGTYWIRRNALIWHQVEPEEGMRNWEALEGLEMEMITASEHGQEVILIVRGTPNWAQRVPGYFCGPIFPEKLSAFAAFMADAVARYSVPPYNVNYWELGNEPDVAPELVGPHRPFGCWGDLEDEYYGGRYYAEMLKAVVPAMKAADPQAQVLVGGLLLDCDPINPPETSPGSAEFRDCTPSRFLEGILENGGGDYFDGVSFHGYDYYLGSYGQYFHPGWHSSWDTTGPISDSKAQYIRKLLDQYGSTDKYLMNTENALICGSTGKEDPCLTEDYELTKANYLAQSYAQALANNLKVNIWYSVRGWRGSGLVKDDQITPAYAAYQFASGKLEGVAFVRQIQAYPDVIGYEYLDDDKLTWVLWSRDGDSHPIDLPRPPLAIYDVFGDPLEVSQEVVVTLAPVYIKLPAE